jgi:molecular chaperone HtpG
MSEVVAQVSLAGLLGRQKPIEDSVYVGKDVLDLLTGSMYLDPLNIYREYVQNAADSIDEARDTGLPFPPGPQIAFEFNHQDRSVRIRDCGIAIPAVDFVRRLTTIGASGKRGKKQRGFRGVGRLSGLGYCQELVFRSRAEGEAKVSELRWDGRVLREKMRDPAFVGGLAEIVAAAAMQSKLPGDGFPARFFEVELRKVQRLRNDLLLNEAAVKGYLSQVAPVPFAPSFSHGDFIQTKLSHSGMGRTVDIQFAGDPVPVYHRATDEFPVNEKVTDKIAVIEPVEYRDSDGELVAIGWLGHHTYAGAISRRLGLGGVRLRCGNIQVGDERILSHLFPEPRFSAWTIGDIHVVSPKIVPNGRRDEFEPSVHYVHLQNELTLTMKSIAQRIRSHSIQRNRTKRVQSEFTAVDDWVAIARNKKLHATLLPVVSAVASERLQLAVKEVSKLDRESEDRKLADARIASFGKALTKIGEKLPDAPAVTGKKGKVAHQIQAALKTILTSSHTPKKGIELASKVIAAMEAARGT